MFPSTFSDVLVILKRTLQNFKKVEHKCLLVLFGSLGQSLFNTVATDSTPVCGWRFWICWSQYYPCNTEETFLYEYLVNLKHQLGLKAWAICVAYWFWFGLLDTKLVLKSSISYSTDAIVWHILRIFLIFFEVIRMLSALDIIFLIIDIFCYYYCN